MTSKVVIGIFDDYVSAGDAIEALKTAGFSTDDLSIVGRDLDDMRPVTSHVVETDRPDKTVTGMTIGGAAAGFLIGLASMALPGVGALFVAGPIMAAISGAAAGTYIGFLAGALTHFDVPQYQADIYESQLTAGKVLVAVHTEVPEERAKAEQVMDQFGAIEVDTKAA
jgi:hypothetical protein